MNAVEFCELLGGINENYVAEARRAKPKRYKRWIIAAACFCIAVGVTCHKIEHPWRIRLDFAETFISSGEIARVPRWEEMTVTERFGEVELDGIRFRVHGAPVEDALLGDVLGEADAEGYDIYTDTAYTAHTELRKIVGISPECAAAVKYDGTDGWYAAVNSWYRPETLGQFIGNLNLHEHISFGTVYYTHRKAISGGYATVCFDGVDDAKIWELLLSETDAVNEYDDVELLKNRPQKILGISVDIPLLGYENISLSVHEGGYIITNILDTGKMFYIGEENTQAFVDYVLKECRGYEKITIPLGEAVPE